MISDEINSLIERVKQRPNGETRNSLLGRLKDARAHAFVLEREEFMSDPMEKLRKGGVVKGTAPNAAEDYIEPCICPAPGVINSACRARHHKLS